MKEFRDREYVINITKDPDADVLKLSEATQKFKDLTKEEKDPDIEVEIKRKKCTSMDSN